MNIVCPNCSQTCETDAEPVIGQHVLCPFCKRKFSYGQQPAKDGTIDNSDMPTTDQSEEVKQDVDQQNVKVSNSSRTRHLDMRTKIKLTSRQMQKLSMQMSQPPATSQGTTKPNAWGCLPAALFFIAFFMVTIMHNWISVLMSIIISFTGIMMCVYHNLNKQMEGAATLNDAFKRLGIGGSSISVVALAFACVFLMHSCDRQAKEEELERQIAARQRQAEYEKYMSERNRYSITCPVCNFKGPVLIKIGSNLYEFRRRCPSCGYWMDYRHLLPEGY